uniref:Uncharacterized protein n=1 Tax=Candidatus Kentrum sp. LPFa TaxID=2126335 RepID=A0A450WTX6_9GAMM|nr:MAG: hypothetical protein BECKLPF1236B_GA0070989_12132 [Candidatus Kentron sp. LPFa]
MEHGGVSNTLADINWRCDVGANDRVLALSALYFDLSVYDRHLWIIGHGRRRRYCS